MEFTCSYCSSIFQRRQSTRRNSKSGHFFCNRRCKELCQIEGKIPEILPKHYNQPDKRVDYRKRALALLGKDCQNPACPIRANGILITEYMLDVDHINSDRSDNRLENLRVLCVWCHRLKTSKSWGLGDSR